MTQFFKGIALFVTVVCVVWIAVLWQWRTNNRAMVVDDIVVYLGLLPLAAFAFVLALRWAWRSAAKRQTEAAATAAAATTAAAAVPAAPTAPSADELARHATVQLLWAQAVAPCGGNVESILAAVKDGQPRPEPDGELRDADGLPVMAARIADLDTDSVLAALEPLLPSVRGQQDEWAAAELPDEVLRALAALEGPLQEALAALAPWSQRFDAVPAEGQGRPAAPPQSLLRVLVGWPSGWSNFAHAAAAAWLRQHLAGQPDGPVALREPLLTARTGTGADLWLEAERVMALLSREKRSDLLLVVACHSSISADAVDMLEQQQRLFTTARNPKGVMPGEAAVALLLAPDDWPADPQAESAPVRLHRAAAGQRDKSVEAAGRVSSAVLAELARQAVAASRLNAGDVALLACDADQHTQRGTELFGASIALLPHLDASEDMALTGSLTGEVGAPSVLLAIASAAAAAMANNKPCIALTLADPFARLALVARPSPTP